MNRWHPRRVVRRLLPAGSIRRSSSEIYLLQAPTLVFALFGGVMIARALGPSQKGVIDLFALLTSLIAELGTLGFGFGAVYYLTKKRRDLAVVHGTTLAYTLLTGLVICGAALVGYHWWAGFFRGIPDWALVLCVLQSPVILYQVCWSNLILGANKASIRYRIALGGSALTFLAVGTLFAMERLTATTVIMIIVMVAVAQAVLAFFSIWSSDRRLEFSTSLALDCARYGLFLYVANIANFIHFKADQLVINHFLGTGGVGIYALSVRWAEMLFVFDEAIFAASLHRIASCGRREGRQLALRLVRVQLGITGAVGVCLAILAYPIVRFIYGPEYVPAVIPLIVLIPGVTAWSTAKLLGIYLNYNLADTRWMSGMTVLSAAANVVLTYVLVAWCSWNVFGAALASSITYVAAALAVLGRAAALNRRAAGPEPGEAT